MYKVMLVDDETIELKYLVHIFEQYRDEYTVVCTAQNGVEALEKFRKFLPQVIVTDIKMPLMNGLDFSLRIKEEYPSTIVILNTAYAEFEFAKKALEYKLDAYILKPTSPSEILKTLNECKDKHASLMAQASGRPMKTDNPIACVKNYIDNHLDKELRLNELAEIAHFSPTHFSKVFRDMEGVQVSKYINQKRMVLAKELMVTSKETIAVISVKCGFKNISNFNRCFKTHYGKTPSEYRQSQRR